MSLETQIAALVTAANNLTGNVSGKIAEIDAALVAAGVSYNAQLEDLKNRLPRLAVTKNMVMEDSDANSLVDKWGMHAEVTATKLKTINRASEATGRTADEIALLAQIEADVKEIYPDFDIRKSAYYRTNFNVWKFQWAANALQPNAGYLAYPYAADNGPTVDAVAVPVNSYITVGGFVRVVEGTVGLSWATGARAGKWTWCSSIISPSRAFGVYTHLHPVRNTPTGIVEVALAGACTGVVSHPGAWFGMMALSA